MVTELAIYAGGKLLENSGERPPRKAPGRHFCLTAPAGGAGAL